MADSCFLNYFGYMENTLATRTGRINQSYQFPSRRSAFTGKAKKAMAPRWQILLYLSLVVKGDESQNDTNVHNKTSTGHFFFY